MVHRVQEVPLGGLDERPSVDGKVEVGDEWKEVDAVADESLASGLVLTGGGNPRTKRVWPPRRCRRIW